MPVFHTGCRSGHWRAASLCTAHPHTLPSINLNYNNEFNWSFKPAAISELYNRARLQPACRVNALDVIIIIHSPPLKRLHTLIHHTQSYHSKVLLMHACIVACNRVIKLTSSPPRVQFVRIQHDETISSEKALALTPLVVLSHSPQAHEYIKVDTCRSMHTCIFYYSTLWCTSAAVFFFLAWGWLKQIAVTPCPPLSIWPIGEDISVSLESRPHCFPNQVTGYTKNSPSEGSTADRLCC